jgi:hypothetical protein
MTSCYEPRCTSALISKPSGFALAATCGGCDNGTPKEKAPHERGSSIVYGQQ